MSSYQHPDLVALDEVEDILEAYAEARLTPTNPILARMRATVMTEAAAYAALRAAERRQVEAATVEVAAPRRFGFPRLTVASFARPAFAMGFAFMLALGTGAAVTAAPPGSPFYNTRVALEVLFLPTQIDARLASHEQHLEERLAEAEAAAARGDANALAAALAAFQAELDATISDAGDDFARLEQFQAVLEKHLAKLTALSARLPTEVARQNAVEHAIQASEKAVTEVKEKKQHAKNRPSTPPRQEPDRPDRPDRPDLPEPANRP